MPCFAKGNVVTQWKAKLGGETGFLTFYSDKTADCITIDEDGDSYEEFSGSYFGDTTKDGKISIEVEGNTTIVEIVGNLLKFDDFVFIKVK